MGTKKKSLSETFSDLLNPAPLFDPEDTEHPETVAKVVENEESYSEEDNVTSTLRKRKFDFLEDGDERYEGTRISRKVLKPDSSDSEGYNSAIEKTDSSEDEDGSAGSQEEDYDGELMPSQDESDDDESKTGSEDDESKTGSENDADDGNMFEQSNESDSDFQHLSRTGSKLEVEKAVAVRNQLNIWDSILECRINIQKTLVASNKFPQYNTFPQFLLNGGSTFKSEVKHTKKSVATLLEKLIKFQTTMLESYPETKNVNKNLKNKTSTSSDDEEINSDTEDEDLKNDKEDRKVNSDIEEHSSSQEDNEMKKRENIQKKQRSLKEYAKLLEEHHNKYKEYWNATIQKWNDKTRITVGKPNNRNFSNFEQSTLKQIEQVLSNRHRLIQRTQLKRSSYNILGQELVPEENLDQQCYELNPVTDTSKDDQDQNKQYNTEIFDDSDFYHQLLRELIQRKSSDVTDPVQLSKQWVQLQKLRSKMKKKFDRGATKGRKIQYVVHPKLVSFMAPVNQNTWSEEAKTELYNSLFGSRKS